MPNSEISHLETFFINLQTGNITFGNTYEWDDINIKFPRNCMKCKRNLTFRQALIHATIKGLTEKEFEALWMSDIVEFLCCSCFIGRTRNTSDALDALVYGVAEWIE